MTAYQAAARQPTNLRSLAVAIQHLFWLAATAQVAWAGHSEILVPSTSSFSSSTHFHWLPIHLQQKLHWKQSITPLQDEGPYVIAHRGASGVLPEHTLLAYARAIAQGADFIECDIVVTKDLQLICRHEPELNSTTDVMSLFPDRLMTYNIDGESVTGVFASDLTLKEIKQLHAKQRWAFRDHSYDGKYQIATLDEFLQLADFTSKTAGRAIGIYPELKHPSWHNSLPQMKTAGTTIEDLVVEKLHAWGYAGSAPVGSATWRSKPVFVQCFEPTSLQKLADMTDMPLVLLLGGWDEVAPDVGLTLEEMTTEAYLEQLTKYISGVGPSKSSLYVESSAEKLKPAALPMSSLGDAGNVTDTSNSRPVGDGHQYGTSACKSGRCSGFLSSDSAAKNSSSSSSSSSGEQRGSSVKSSGLVAKLQGFGFQIHPYTVRDEPRFVPTGCEGDVKCELSWLIDEQGVDGVFTDFPGTMVDWLASRDPEN